MFRDYLNKLFVFLVAFNCSSVAYAQYYGADDWMDMGRATNDKFQMYLNKSALKFIDTEIYSSFKAEYRSEQQSKQGFSYTTSISNFVIDCKNETSIFLKTDLINSSGKVIDTWTISKEFGEWKKIPPGSFLGMTSKKYCQQALEVHNANSKRPASVQIPTSNDKINGSSQKCLALGFKEGSSAFDRCMSQLNN